MDSDTRTDEERAADERAIRAMHGQVLDALGAGNGKAFAAPFSDDALFIGYDGSVMRGRRQIAATHQEVFDRWIDRHSTDLGADRSQLRQSRRGDRAHAGRNGDAWQVQPTPEPGLDPDPGRGQGRGWLVVRLVPEHPHPAHRGRGGIRPAGGSCPTASGDSSSASPRQRRERSPGSAKRANELGRRGGGAGGGRKVAGAKSMLRELQKHDHRRCRESVRSASEFGSRPSSARSRCAGDRTDARSGDAADRAPQCAARAART
jgi:hypothetical protein